MSELIKIDELYQRSRARVKGLGEVFTPEAYVEDMLKILSKDKRGFWSDEATSFFEPSCGHGNIVLPIYRKRVEAIYAKNLSLGPKEAALYAVANALNTIWAIDIDSKNINQCRARVLSYTIDFLVEKTSAASFVTLLKKNLNYMSHILCAISWHIHENDTLSSLSSSENASKSASKTRAGYKWLQQNGHKKLNFDLTWVKNYEDSESKKVIPIEFERASKFIRNVITGSAREVSGLEYAYELLGSIKLESNPRNSSKDTPVGL